jgi:hypothetical protein
VANFNVSLSDDRLIDLFTDFAAVADAAARGAASFCHMSAVPAVAAVECLDVVQLL